MPLDVNALARLGAQARLAELEQELNDLQAAFPELRGIGAARASQAPAKEAAAHAETGGETSARPGRRSSSWSAAQRAAVGRRMKKYWAEKRKAGAAAGASAATAPKAAAAAKKRVMSPEARARISAAQKKRWAAHRSAKKS